MKIYLVGGAVRDALLGLVEDRDWVVVGGTPQEMLDAGYQQVGRDFPVFLHPQTHEEYALARTERKSGLPVTPVLLAMPHRMSRWKMILSVAIWRRMRWPRTITARLSTRSTVWRSAKSSVAPCFRLRAKIRYAFCAWRVLLRVMPTSVFVLPMKL